MVERKKNRPFPPREAAVQKSENRGERIENKLKRKTPTREKCENLHKIEGVQALCIQTWVDVGLVGSLYGQRRGEGYQYSSINEQG